MIAIMCLFYGRSQIQFRFIVSQTEAILFKKFPSELNSVNMQGESYA